MEGKRFVETERSNRLSPDVVRHGLDQSSSLSVHQSPLSQQCKHRKLLTCDNFVSPASFTAFERCIVVPNFVLHQYRKQIERRCLVCVEGGRDVALNVDIRRKVRLEVPAKAQSRKGTHGFRERLADTPSHEHFNMTHPFAPLRLCGRLLRPLTDI